MAERAVKGTATLIAALLAISVLIGGCSRQEPEFGTEDQVPADVRTGGAGEPAPDAAVLTFVAVDLAYSQAPATAPAGALVIRIVNEGQLPHNVVFEGVMDDQIIAEAQPGQTATGRVGLAAGTYTYYCSIPGHREAGMEGRLEVN